jgi:hypothetical protein
MPRGRPLLRRLRLPFRHECIDWWCRNGGSNAGFRLTKAVPCHWTIAAQGFVWCWLEDSNLPPLAYEASALPDELSQQVKLTKGARRHSLCGSDLVRCAEARRRVQFWTFTMSKSAAPTGTVIMRMRSRGPKHAQTRACPRHTDGFRMFCG